MNLLSRLRVLKVHVLVASIALLVVACQDGGLVGTGSGPAKYPVSIRSLPSKLSPDLPASMVDTQDSETVVVVGGNSTKSRWTSPSLFDIILSAEIELIELFTLFNTAMQDVEDKCKSTNIGQACILPEASVVAVYSQSLVNELIQNRLSSTAAGQLASEELAQYITAITSHYDSKLHSSVMFGETIFTRESLDNDIRMLETSTSGLFYGIPIYVRWSEDEGWAEVRHVSFSGRDTVNTYFRYAESGYETQLTHTRLVTTPNVDYESTITLLGEYQETPTVMWSGHELGIKNEYGLTSISMKGRADTLGSYSRRRLHSASGTDALRLVDYEASRDDMGQLLATRFCSGALESPICINRSVGASYSTVEDNPNYVDFDNDENAFLPDIHTSRWKVENLPSTVSRFAVFLGSTSVPDNALPLCRGYRMARSAAVLHCTSDDTALNTSDVRLFEIVPTQTGQQFVYMPNTTLARSTQSR